MLSPKLDRRRLLQSAGLLGGMAATFPAWADTYIDLDLPGGPDKRELSTAFPQKAQMTVRGATDPDRPPIGRLDVGHRWGPPALNADFWPPGQRRRKKAWFPQYGYPWRKTW